MIKPILPPWLEVAYKEIDTKEIKGSKHEPRIVEYHQTTSLMSQDDETPWCSSFVNWCIKQAGFKGTNSAAARSWLKWGYLMSYPAFGCIVVLSRSKPWQGHVGFYVGMTERDIGILGGNQGDKVSINYYDRSRVIGYRWP